MKTEQELEAEYMMQYEESIKQAQVLIQKGVLSVAAIIRENNNTGTAYRELQRKYETLLKEHTKCFKEDIQGEFQRQNNWFMRLRYIITKENRPMTGREITQVYPKYDPEWESRFHDLRNCIQQALHDALEEELLRAFPIPKTRGWYYGLPAFFDAKGALKPEYKLLDD